MNTRAVSLGLTAAILLSATAALAQNKDEIIWNDPPKSGASSAASAAKNASAPIRDDYAKPAAKPAESAKSTAASGWSEPSMASNGTVGKSNTSTAAAGACHDFQQDVIIDGHKEKAHGRACRQPDGSWKIVN